MERFLLEQYKYGWERTYMYELFDTNPDPGKTVAEKNWGLFFNNGTPKPAAKGISAMITLLKDAGGGTTNPGTLDYTLKDMPSTGDQLLLEKSNGKFYLALWNEVDNWNEKTDRAITYNDQNVTLSLGSIADKVVVYRPLTNGTTAIGTYDKVQNVKLGVPDHPLIVEITPAGKGGNGDVISVVASGDSYNGAPTMVFRVDGKEVYRTDVTAAHKTGQWQTYSWTAKDVLDGHRVEVGFVNDLYGGTATMDRNLMLKSVRVGDALLLNQETKMGSNGTKVFTVPHGPDTPPAVEVSSKITVNASGDSYKGAPEMIFRVDGHQVFSTAVTAAHSQGKWTDYTWTSPTSLNNSNLEIVFTNDLYEGSSSKDRNLWLKSVKVDDHSLLDREVNVFTDNGPIFHINLDAAHAVGLVGVAPPNDALHLGA